MTSMYVTRLMSGVLPIGAEIHPCWGGYDSKDTGNPEKSGAWVPGLRIEYTQPMPTEDDLDAYRGAAGKGSQPTATAQMPLQSASAPTATPNASTPASANGNGNGATGEFTWANMDGAWCVRGPKDRVGQRVEVVRKNGTTSKVTLRGVAERIGDLWFYAV